MSSTPLREVLTRIKTETDIAAQKKARPFVAVGRARRLASESHHTELKELLEGKPEGHVGSEMRKTMGDVAATFVVSGIVAGLVVVQAAGKSTGDRRPGCDYSSSDSSDVRITHHIAFNCTD